MVSAPSPESKGGRVSRRVSRLFDVFLLVVIAVIVVAVSFFLLRSERYLLSTGRIVVLVVLPALAAAGVGGLFLLPADRRAGVAMMLFFVGSALYLIEILLAFSPLGGILGKPDVEQQGALSWQKVLRHVQTLRADGMDAYMLIAPQGWVQWSGPLLIEGDPVLPLAGVANATTVVCNESGEFLVYESDQFGFNNPPEVWEFDRADVALIGDSFVQGACAPAGESFASLIRREHPATLNIGFSSNGPLLELAGLYEYVAPKRPEHVFWFFYGGNDIGQDLAVELSSDILRYYLDSPGFRQHLMSRSGEIDRAMRASVDPTLGQLAEASDLEPRKPSILGRAARVLRLQSLRARLGLQLRGAADAEQHPETEELWTMFQKIIGRANEAVGQWGGRLHLVYLPGRDLFARGLDPPHYQEFLDLSERLGLDVIDIYAEVARHPDPLSLFPQRTRQLSGLDLHYNQDGHRVVARAVLSALATD